MVREPKFAVWLTFTVSAVAWALTLSSACSRADPAGSQALERDSGVMSGPAAAGPAGAGTTTPADGSPGRAADGAVGKAADEPVDGVVTGGSAGGTHGAKVRLGGNGTCTGAWPRSSHCFCSGGSPCPWTNGCWAQ